MGALSRCQEARRVWARGGMRPWKPGFWFLSPAEMGVSAELLPAGFLGSVREDGENR